LANTLIDDDSINDGIDEEDGDSPTFKVGSPTYNDEIDGDDQTEYV